MHGVGGHLCSTWVQRIEMRLLTGFLYTTPIYTIASMLGVEWVQVGVRR